jgi:hypothetical protein
MSIEEAKAECIKPGVCPHKITPKEARFYTEVNK